jgi:KDO2-lipid IV(A) lauroyltransferase
MSVSAAPAALSYRTGTPIILVFCLPRPKGYYRIHIRKIITPPAFDKTRNTKDVVQDITQDIVNTLSDQITDTPEFWLWSHRYWRRRKGNCYPAHYPTY